ncbi:MAG TPA: PaaI family thioesterase [Xanthobacteraceae bacterium]|nr:PaaI family thioesterase [Xanthobacteraceae bacterium]
MMAIQFNTEFFKTFGKSFLPGELGVEILEVGKGTVKSRMAVEKRHLAPNGYLHAASVIALADTSAGYGCVASLPEGAKGFTTIELKANFLGTAREGVISCVATAEHLGRTTQVWSATVTDATDKTLVLFRCTQMLLR